MTLVEFLPIGMFLALFLLLALGIPVAFSLFSVAISFALLAWGIGGGDIVVASKIGRASCRERV